jgi:hypothetical protein
VILSVCLIAQTLAAFAAPIGINRLLKSVIIIYGSDYCLSYLETGGADISILPWFWIFWLLVGPIVRNTRIYFQSYIFIATRTIVRTEGLLTQQVFEHNLRIRLKAEASNEKVEESLVPKIAHLAAEGEAVDSISDERTSEPPQASTAFTRDSTSNQRGP